MLHGGTQVSRGAERMSIRDDVENGANGPTPAPLVRVE